MRRSIVLATLALLTIVAGSSAHAQIGQVPGLMQEGRVANYRFAAEGELSITIGLVGAVRMPGRYEVSRSMDILDLLALAGGWSELADLSDVKINRLVGGGSEKGVRQTVTLDLSDFQAIQRNYLALQDGDYVYVGTRSGLTAQEVVSYVTAIGVLVTVYVTISSR